MRIVIAAIIAVTAVSQANASTFSITPTVIGFFDDAFGALPDYDDTDPTSGPAIVQVDFALTFSDPTDASLGFGNIAFDVELLEGLTENGLAPGWQAINPQVDTNGAIPGGLLPLFANNGDFGGADLKDIVVGVAAGLNTGSAVDPRVRVGVAQPEAVGTLFLDYAGGGVFAKLMATPTQAGSILDGGELRQESAPSLLGGSVTLGVPEPSTCILAGLALVGFAARRNG